MSSSCAESAVKDVEKRTVDRNYPESIVYKHPGGKPELDSWIQPGCTVRLWATLLRNTHPVHRLFSAKLTDNTRMNHVLAEFVTFKDGRRRDFDMGFMYAGSGDQFGHELRTYQGRIISPDWIFVDKANAQAKKPQNEYIRLLAMGTLSKSVWRRLKDLVESPESKVVYETEKEGRHVYDIRHPSFGRYRGAVPWISGVAAGGCHNCSSFVMEMFGDMLTCVTISRLVVPGSCRPLPGGMKFQCTENGLPSSNQEDEPQAKRRRLAAH